MSKNTTPKPVSMSIRFRPPRGTKGLKASIRPATGEIVFTDDAGAVVIPEYMERSLHYERTKGRKIQSRNRVDQSLVTIGGLSEFARYESLFVIDTNSHKIGSERVSAACFFAFRLTPDGDKFRLEPESTLSFYEFRGVSGNPELLAVLKVATDVERSAGVSTGSRFAVITDSALAQHDAINSRAIPIYGDHYLPAGFTLLYASADTGQEFLNRLIRFCDREAVSYLQHLADGKITGDDFQVLAVDNAVRYRHRTRKGLEVVNPVIGEMQIPEGTKIALYGLRRSRDE
jgi:hypothetical protein